MDILSKWDRCFPHAHDQQLEFNKPLVQLAEVGKAHNYPLYSKATTQTEASVPRAQAYIGSMVGNWRKLITHVALN